MVTLLCSGVGFSATNAQTLSASELQAQLDQKNQDIAALEKEIAGYQTQITATLQSANTLQGEIKKLDLTKKKLDTDIRLTQKKIDATELSIQQLSRDIGDKQARIEIERQGIEESIRQISMSDDSTLFERIQNHRTLSDYLDIALSLNRFQAEVATHTAELAFMKESLTNTKTAQEKKKQELNTFRSQLQDQRSLAIQNQQEKDRLLKETKNQEANYRKILADKEKLRASFQKEIANLEAKLKLIDPSHIPQAHAGILSWPLDRIRITQIFGDTDFARAHSQLYSGKGHNGIDLAAPQGTPIKAAETGIVVGTGNTDSVCPGASYGKWVLIRHNNGLSTLYAHLSLIKVGEGQNIGVGELVGYSGSTGYATGPHLHFTVYLSEGVQVTSRKSTVCAGTYRMPIADLRAYLNPLDYLPAL